MSEVRNDEQMATERERKGRSKDIRGRDSMLALSECVETVVKKW